MFDLFPHPAIASYRKIARAKGMPGYNYLKRKEFYFNERKSVKISS
jgi:hypothetical protein